MSDKISIRIELTPDEHYAIQRMAIDYELKITRFLTTLATKVIEARNTGVAEIAGPRSGFVLAIHETKVMGTMATAAIPADSPTLDMGTKAKKTKGKK